MDELKRELEGRKFRLVNMLKFEVENLALERQHQIYGAIKELDMVLGMIVESQKNNESEFELKSMPKQELMNRISKKLR